VRSIDLKVGPRTYTFALYQGFAAINVKAHVFVEPGMLPPELRAQFDQLPQRKRNELTEDAWIRVQEMWWSDTRETPREVGRVNQAGRSGGYLTLPEWSESRLFEYADEADSSGCETCPGIDFLRLGVAAHGRAELEHAGSQLPLPLPARATDGACMTAYDPTCKVCGEEYSDHVGYRCPSQLGATYSPHAYTNRAVEVLDILDAFFTETAKRVEPARIRDDLQHTFICIVEDYLDEKPFMEEASES